MPETWKHWTKRDDEFLRKHSGKIAVSQMASRLKRSEKATRTRIERLGIHLLEARPKKPKIIRKKYRGWHFDSYGRRHISVKGLGSVPEHRYLVEQDIGRKLSRAEHIHHINCDKTDNKIENLFLCKDVSAHLTCHRSLEVLIKPLMEQGVIAFDRKLGRYKLCSLDKQ